MYARATGVLYVFTLILEVRLLFIKSLHMNLIPHRHSNLICQVTQASYTSGVIVYLFSFLDPPYSNAKNSDSQHSGLSLWHKHHEGR